MSLWVLIFPAWLFACVVSLHYWWACVGLFDRGIVELIAFAWILSSVCFGVIFMSETLIWMYTVHCTVPEIGSWINIPHRTVTLLQIQHSLCWSPGALGPRIWKNGVKIAIYRSKMGRFFLYNIRIMRINAHLMHIGRYIRMANPTMECAL